VSVAGADRGRIADVGLGCAFSPAAVQSTGRSDCSQAGYLDADARATLHAALGCHAVNDIRCMLGADGGTRTLTGLPPRDFKSLASTIPPRPRGCPSICALWPEAQPSLRAEGEAIQGDGATWIASSLRSSQ
jgi:hypothetical protein